MDISQLPQELRVKILLYTDPRDASIVASTLGVRLKTLLEEIRLYAPLDIEEIVGVLRYRKLVHDKFIGSASKKLYLLARDIPYLSLDYERNIAEYTLTVIGADPMEVANSINAFSVENYGEYVTFSHLNGSLVRNIDVIRKTGRPALLSLTEISVDSFRSRKLPLPDRANTSFEELVELMAPGSSIIDFLSTLLTTLQWRKAKLESLSGTIGYKLFLLTQGRLSIRERYDYTEVEVPDELASSTIELLGERVLNTRSRWDTKVIEVDLPGLMSQVALIHNLSMPIGQALLEDTDSGKREIIFEEGRVV
jgi:hypothetical protein